MTLEIALVFLVAFLCYREWYHSMEMQRLEDRYFKERQMLLDRIMAVDFTRYKQAEAAVEMAKQPQGVSEPEDYFDYGEVGN